MPVTSWSPAGAWEAGPGGAPLWGGRLLPGAAWFFLREAQTWGCRSVAFQRLDCDEPSRTRGRQVTFPVMLTAFRPQSGRNGHRWERPGGPQTWAQQPTGLGALWGGNRPLFSFSLHSAVRVVMAPPAAAGSTRWVGPGPVVTSKVPCGDEQGPLQSTLRAFPGRLSASTSSSTKWG